MNSDDVDAENSITGKQGLPTHVRQNKRVKCPTVVVVSWYKRIGRGSTLNPSNHSWWSYHNVRKSQSTTMENKNIKKTKKKNTDDIISCHPSMLKMVQCCKDNPVIPGRQTFLYPVASNRHDKHVAWLGLRMYHIHVSHYAQSPGVSISY